MSFLEKWWVVVGKKRKQTHYITGQFSDFCTQIETTQSKQQDGLTT